MRNLQKTNIAEGWTRRFEDISHPTFPSVEPCRRCHWRNICRGPLGNPLHSWTLRRLSCRQVMAQKEFSTSNIFTNSTGPEAVMGCFPPLASFGSLWHPLVTSTATVPTATGPAAPVKVTPSSDRNMAGKPEKILENQLHWMFQTFNY